MIESQRTIGKIVSKYSVLGFAAVIMVLTVTLTLSPSQKVWAIQISNDNITIIKQTNPDGSPDKFNFTPTLGNFTLSDGQNKTFSGLVGNGATYNFTEMVPPD